MIEHPTEPEGAEMAADTPDGAGTVDEYVWTLRQRNDLMQLLDLMARANQQIQILSKCVIGLGLALAVFMITVSLWFLTH